MQHYSFISLIVIQLETKQKAGCCVNISATTFSVEKITIHFNFSFLSENQNRIILMPYVAKKVNA